jgi:hypothetical protein
MLKTSPTRIHIQEKRSPVSVAAKQIIIDPSEHKHLLIQSINNLSNRIQQTKVEIDDSGKGNYVILKLENEALDHIEHTILNIFNSILTASGDEDQSTPEQTLTMFHAMNSTGSSGSSVFGTSMNSAMMLMNQLTPIANLNEAEFKARQVLPRNYADEACPKALHIVEKCRAILNSTKRILMLKNKTIISDELDHIFTFPVEKINQLLSRIYNAKFDLYVTIYLVAILEYIAKDMLHLATCYASYLNKYSISKEDICTAIHADYILNKLLNVSVNGGIHKSYNDLFEECENDDEDDDLDSRYGMNNSTLNLQASNLTQIDEYNLGSGSSAVTAISNSSSGPVTSSTGVEDTTIRFIDSISINSIKSDTECTSDSSTICAESISSDQSNLKYYTRVKELLLEQTQHLNDLNILRRIFMYLLQKFCTQHNVPDTDQLIENIFGNVNEVYEMALRLSDLIDQPMMTSSLNQTNQNQLAGQQGVVFVGDKFWELAEGEEFDVYLKYALSVTSYKNVTSSLQTILSNQNVCNSLRQTSPGLADISRYLLPKLLLGSVYHIFYLYETVEYLASVTSDDDDKISLNNTLDTLKPIRFRLKEFGFISSKRRPIETSFRLFQPHQFQQQIVQQLSGNTSTAAGDKSMVAAGSVSLNNSEIASGSTYHNSSNTSGISSSARVQALASNVSLLTEKKWKEMESNVESFKLPPSKIFIQNRSNESKLKRNWLFSKSKVFK